MYSSYYFYILRQDSYLIELVCYNYMFKNLQKSEFMERSQRKTSFKSGNSSPFMLVNQSQVSFQRFDLQGIPISSNKTVQSQTISKEQEQKPKSSQFLKLEQLQKKLKSKDETRRNRSLSIKMKSKLHQQVKNVHRVYEDKVNQLNELQIQHQSLNQTLADQKRMKQQSANNQQMLHFKEKQLNNLITIHCQLLESAKKEILNEKNVKIAHQEKITALKKKLAETNEKIIDKKRLKDISNKLKEQKIHLQNILQNRKEAEAKKNQIRSEAIYDLLKSTIKKSKRQLQQELQYKVKSIRQCQLNMKAGSDFKKFIQQKGITSREYYTFTQLKYVPQLNFRRSKQSEKVMENFYKQINPKIPIIIEHYEQPIEYIRLKQQLANLEKQRLEKQKEIEKKGLQRQALLETKALLKKNQTDLKEKNEKK